MEVWKEIPGFEGLYEASDLGHIRSFERVVATKNGKLLPKHQTQLKPYLTQHGYLRVCLQYGKFKRSIFVHRLVALAFIPNLENKPLINHIDNDRSNNLLSNLEWCTHTENVRHSMIQGRFTRKTINPEKLRDIKDCLDAGLSMNDIAKTLKVSRNTIKKYFR